MEQHIDGSIKLRRYLSPLSAWALSFFLALSLLSRTLFGAEHTPRKVVRIPSTYFNRLMIVDENNQPVSGYAYDYIQTIATYAKWDVQYVPCHGFADCVEKLLAGEVDLFYDVSYTEERAKAILYPDEPMGHEYYYLYSAQGNNSVDPGDYETFRGKKVGITRGTMQIGMLKGWCEKKGVELDFIEYKSIPDKEADLVAGKIDLDLEVSMLAKRNLSAVEKVGSSEYYLVANKARPDLIADINSAIDKILKNDIYYFARLEERYFSDTVLSYSLIADERNWLESHKTLRVGYFNNYLPFSTRDENGQPYGAGIDAIREIAKNLNLEEKGIGLDFVCFDNQEDGYRAVESGEIDVIFPVYVSKSLKQDYRIISGKVLATFTSDTVYSGESRKDHHVRIGVNRKNLMQYYYARAVAPDAEIVFYDGIEGCLDGLLDGTCDETFLNGYRSDALLKPAKYHSVRKVQAQQDLAFRMAFADDNVGLMLLMDRGLAMLDSDFVNKTVYSYIVNMYSFTMMDFIAEHMLSIIAIAAILVALLVALVGYRVSNAKLSGINRQLQEHAEMIEEQRSQLEKKQGELEDALHQAQIASSAKTVFLSNMSHDIRTPMNAIIGFADLALGSIDDKAQVKDCLSTISSSADYLLSLINNVLDMSRIEAGKLKLNEKAESLGNMLYRIEDVVQADVQARRHDFSIDMADVRDDVIVCDKTRLMEVLINLVSNAIKYTNPGGTISLTVAKKPSAQKGRALYEFRVKDNGIGIDEEFSKIIFDAFTRERSTTVSGIQGTGLGMAITKNLVEKMGGQISLTSKKGEGSEFLVAVEFKLAEPQVGCVDPAEPQGKKISLEGKKVLMVDDSSLNRKIQIIQFRKHGAIVDVAENGRIAVEKIRDNGVDAYDFVLMDVQMPVMGGYEATAEIRKLPGGDKLPIIAYSANAFEEDKQESLKAGMNGHLTKPLKIDELLAELGRILA